LALFIEIMTGSFLGRIMGDQNPSGGSVQDSHGHSITRGAMILVMNPKMTTDLDQFKNANSELLQTIKSVHKLPGVEEIHIPGEQALETRNRNLKNGYLDIDENLWQTINS
jgi:LDH2 family malate/lactate/ureidoglycolate dehydrogenase